MLLEYVSDVRKGLGRGRGRGEVRKRGSLQVVVKGKRYLHVKER